MELEGAFLSMVREHAQAVLVLSSPFVLAELQHLPLALVVRTLSALEAPAVPDTSLSLVSRHWARLTRPFTFTVPPWDVPARGLRRR